MSTTNNSLPKLHYFAVKGVIEVARVLMHIGNYPFEDIRYTFERKANGPTVWSDSYLHERSVGHFASNMDRVPVFEVNGTRFGQTKAIEVYISYQCKLLGASDEEAAVIDCVVENVRDIKEKWGKIRWGSSDGPDKDAAIAKWYAQDLAEWLTKLEKSLPANADALVIGSSVTYADVVIWSLLRDFFPDQVATRAAETAAGVTRLAAIANRVGDIEALKRYLATRPADL